MKTGNNEVNMSVLGIYIAMLPIIMEQTNKESITLNDVNYFTEISCCNIN